MSGTANRATGPLSNSAAAQVKETMVKFEERLWGILRNFVTLGRDNPAMLVNAVRIVELQEMVDARLEATANRELCRCGSIYKYNVLYT